jgi:hypothetical protein
LLQAAELEDVQDAYAHLKAAHDRLQGQLEEKEAAVAVRLGGMVTACHLLCQCILQSLVSAVGQVVQ